MEETSSYKRNLFEIENARNLNPRELAETFVPTQSFWRLLSAKHHVILGSRGSGKTALAKMLSHDHLTMLNEPRAQNAVRDQQFIGVYVPTRLEWVGGLKNKPWQSEDQKEIFFQWRLNLSSCLALISTLESCIRTYCGDKGNQAIIEIRLTAELSNAWLGDNGAETLDDLRIRLEEVEYNKHLLIAKLRATGEQKPSAIGPGAAFDADLFIPLKRGIALACRTLNLRSECIWLICLDEAEFLDEIHHRIINSHMRAYSGNIFFKLTTMPYCHYTLDTNAGVPLDVGHDFEYAYMDSDPILLAKISGETSTIGTFFARTLFNKRVEASGLRDISITDVLGHSILLDDKDIDWSKDSEQFKLLNKFCSNETILRAERLFGTPKFKSEVSRKINGALLLRKAYEDLKGRAEPEIYSGASLAIRCGDANPRRLIRVFNALLLVVWRSLNRGSSKPRLSPMAQTRILRRLSTSSLVRIQSEPQCGKELYEFLKSIGEYMHRAFHYTPLSTDQVSSITVDKDVTDAQWILIQRAVELGYLFPNIGPHRRDDMPNREGTFRLAFILSPHFFLLPRRGDSRSLNTILQDSADFYKSQDYESNQMKLL